MNSDDTRVGVYLRLRSADMLRSMTIAVATATLAPGVYLVQATVAAGTATEQFTRTITVVR